MSMLFKPDWRKAATINLDHLGVSRMQTEYADPFKADIYVGLRNIATGRTAGIALAKAYVNQCCRKHTVCLSVTETEFIYPSPNKPGREAGIIVGLINYPRFPRDTKELWQISLEIAEDLMTHLYQCHVTVVTKDGSYMLTNQAQIALVQEARE